MDVPLPAHHKDEEETFELLNLGVGTASIDPHARHVTKAERERWRREDRERDRRRIPLGFRASDA